ncbi:MAG TPA: methyltransferase domain-containing protein [Actinomycetes bacterium]|nr:methyltransferase domain-containing protein [Actinomycetes bacterium]
MDGCCGRDGYDQVFTNGFARRVARRYREKGLDRTRQRVVDFLVERGVEGASVLEIGGGVGEIQIELLRRGAASVTNLEISTTYEREAARLLEEFGAADRVQRRILDIAETPNDVESADVVVLHRVVCCYPDYERLLSAAAGHARRLMVFSYPPRNLISRLMMGTENLFRRLQGSSFRTFVHPPARMLGVAESQGLSLRYSQRSLSWTVAGFERE